MVSRRLVGGAPAAAFLAAPVYAFDEVEPETTRMGGLLEKYGDVNRGFRMMKPAIWNQFEGEAGAYDVRFTDLIDVAASVTISTSSYSGKSIDALASLDTLGAKLVKSRRSIVSQSARSTDDIVFYDYEFDANDNYHELLSLCVAKNKLWQISAKAPDKIWAKKKDLFRNVIYSFVPKL